MNDAKNVEWKRNLELGEIFGCSEEAVKELVKSCPQILEINVESLRAKITGLSEVTGCNGEAVGKMVTGLPQLLGLNADSMRAKFTELSKMTGCDVEAVRKMVAKFPRLLGLSTDSMRGRITELSEITGCDEEAAGKLVAGCPRLLSYDTDSMRIKMAFLLRCFGVTVEDVVHNVRLLSHSLEQRLQPRYRFAVQRGKEDQLCRKSVTVTDARFSRLMGASLEEYAPFKARFIEGATT